MTTTAAADSPNSKQLHQVSHDWLLHYAELLGFGEIHIKVDRETGLQAIIAIHNTSRGPAIGGCRCIPYNTFDEALEDALRLAQMMSYKAAVCGLPHGGAKAVLIRPAQITDRVAYFKSFGRFVHELQGRYITAEDSGTNPADMDIISEVTPYVTCTSSAGGNPAPYTALGVRRGIEAAVQFKLKRFSLEGVRVAIQGAGHVGYLLAKQLAERGAILTMSDVYADRLLTCVEEFRVTPVSADDIYDVDCDVFAPCALGAIINADTVARLKAKIIAGSANNQLAHRRHGVMLHEHDILYAPDFVINSGGLIYAAAIYDHGDVEKAHQQIEGLYQTLWEIFERAERENLATSEITEAMALEKLTQSN